MEPIDRDYRGKRVLVTGGLGMIGSNLAHRLVALGAEVTVLDAVMPHFGANHFNLSGIEDSVRVVEADIRDAEHVSAVVKDQDVIFNLAGQVSYIDSLTDPYQDLDINCRGHLVVLEACRQHNPEARVLHAGSRMQYGTIENIPVDEEHRLDPISPYAIHKLAAESYYRSYYRLHGIPVVCFRIANPYGPRHQMKRSEYGIVNYFIKLAMTGETITVFGDGKQIRDYIYIDDLVGAFLYAGVRPDAVGEVLNVGGGVATHFIDMARCVVEIVGSGCVEMVPWPENYKNIETGGYVADLSKTTRCLGWRPTVGLEEGIRRTHAYYQKYREHYW